MEPAVTRPRTLAFIAAVCWWIVAFLLAPTVGRLLLIPRFSGLLLGTLVVFASLSTAVLTTEILRAIISRWSSWTNAHHFYVVLAVAAAFGVLQVLALVFGLSRGYA
jgi:hypothetical protein